MQMSEPVAGTTSAASVDDRPAFPSEGDGPAVAVNGALGQLIVSYEVLSLVVLAFVLLAFVPLFLRMPVWGDTTFFDLAARSLRGRGHCYQELFIHGPPGMIWCQLAVRSLVGWSSEALRVADLFIFSAVVWLLACTAQPRDLPLFGSVWIAAALYVIYFSATEWAHCQPDGWMLLPSVGALCLRQRQVSAVTDASVPGRALARRSLAEGVLWGLAFVIKPFVVFSAVPCLLVGLIPAFRAMPRQRTVWRLTPDLAGLITGGASVGAASFGVLYGSGDWPEFLAATFAGWNRDYARLLPGWRTGTMAALLGWQWPWSVMLAVAVPVAFLLIGVELPGLSSATSGSRDDSHRSPLLAAFFLGWFVQANYLQILNFEYHTLPTVLLGWALVLGWLCREAPARTAGLVPAAAVLAGALYCPLPYSHYLALWVDCLTSPDSDRIRDALARNTTTGRTSWRDLRGVMRYLSERGARDGEVTCWDFSAIPFYMESGLEPSNRFVYPGTRLAFFPSFRQTIQDETMNGPQRYVVMDLLVRRVPERDYRKQMTFPPDFFRPFKPAGVYHSGRYVVLHLAPPADTREGRR
jgi:hypothetical protein